MIEQLAKFIPGVKRGNEQITWTRKDALIAYGLFQYASITCPNSQYGQSAVIALKCKEKELNPTQLADALLHSKDLLSNLVERANQEHASRNIPKKVKGKGLKNAIFQDFKYATSAIRHSTSALQEIVALYPRYSGRESEYGAVIGSIIENDIKREKLAANST